MARQNGRDIDLSIDGGITIIAVLNTKTVNINNNPVDVTGDTDDGWITLLDRPGTRQVTIDASGYTTDTVLRQASLGSIVFPNMGLLFKNALGQTPYVASLGGRFILSAFSETGASDGGIEFTCNFQSSGVIVFSDLT